MSGLSADAAIGARRHGVGAVDRRLCPADEAARDVPRRLYVAHGPRARLRVICTPCSRIIAVIAIAVGAGASGALNMWYDADIDARMARTAARPIPRGRITRR